MTLRWQSLFPPKAHWSLGAALAGGWSFALLCGGGTLPGAALSYLSLVPLFWVLWTYGESALLGSSALVFVLFLIARGFTEALGSAFFYLLPVMLLGRLGAAKFPSSRRGRASSPILHNSLERNLGFFFSGLGALGVLFLTLLEAEVPGGFSKEMVIEISKRLSDGNAKEALQGVLPYLPGFFGVSWMGVIALNLFGARWAYQKMGWKPPFKLSSARWCVASWQYWVLVLALGGASLSTSSLSVLARNLMVFAVVPFLIEGFVISSEALRCFFSIGRGLPFFWGGVAFLGWPLLLVIILGVFEPWINLRGRLALYRKGKS